MIINHIGVSGGKDSTALRQGINDTTTGNIYTWEQMWEDV